MDWIGRRVVVVRLRVICFFSGGVAYNLRWHLALLTPRAKDVPGAGCALFGVVLCRKRRKEGGGRRERGKGVSVVHTVLLHWQGKGSKGGKGWFVQMFSVGLRWVYAAFWFGRCEGGRKERGG